MKLNTFFKVALIVLSFPTVFTGFAQQPQWYIKNHTATDSKQIDFRAAGTPSVASTDPLTPTFRYGAKEGNNAIWNSAGELEIFISNDIVSDPNGNTIFELVNESVIPFNRDPNAISSWDLGICRVPEDCDKYYIIRCAWEETGKKYTLHYYIYDTNTHTFVDFTGLPYAGPSIPGIHLRDHIPELPEHKMSWDQRHPIAVSKLNANNKRFLFYEFQRFLFKLTISNSGIFYVSPYPIYTTGPGLSFNTNISETEVIKTSSGYLYATSVLSTPFNKVILIKLDEDADFLSTQSYETPYGTGVFKGDVKGLEFSKNGQYLYLTTTLWPYIKYIDIGIPFTVNDFNANAVSPVEYNYFLAHRNEISHSAIELAHNGKLYFPTSIGMSSLEDSNDPTSTWINNEITTTSDHMTPYLGWGIGSGNTLKVLPDQVANELLYTPINPISVVGCGLTIPEACVEDYSGFEYYWYDTDLPYALGSGPCFTPTEFGEYIVRVTDENKCTRNYPIQFINDLPQIPPISDVTYCSKNLEAIVNTGWSVDPLNGYAGTYSIDWIYEGNPVTADPHAYRIPYQGDGTYTVTVNTLCGSQTFTYSITDEYTILYDHEIALHHLFDYDDVLDVAKFTSLVDYFGVYDYYWTITDGITVYHSTDPLIVIPYSGTGVVMTITLDLFDSENCITYTNTTTWSNGPTFRLKDDNNRTNVRYDQINEIPFHISPNPSSGLFKIRSIVKTEEPLNLVVLNSIGAVIYQTQMTSPTTEIDLSEFSTGVYFVRAENNKDVWVEKLIIR